MNEAAKDGRELFQTRKFADIALEIIRERIMSGALRPGSRLNEVTLSDELQISRPPLREALSVLSGEGLVRLVPGKGAFVTDLDLDAFIHVGEIRMALEVATARLAAERADATDTARLASLMEALELELREPGNPYPHHIEFHHALAGATKNPRLATALGEVIRQVRLASMQTNENPQRAHEVLVEHRAVADAVLRGDADAAEAAMRSHIAANTDATVTLLKAMQKEAGR